MQKTVLQFFSIRSGLSAPVKTEERREEVDGKLGLFKLQNAYVELNSLVEIHKHAVLEIQTEGRFITIDIQKHA